MFTGGGVTLGRGVGRIVGGAIVGIFAGKRDRSRGSGVGGRESKEG